MTTAAEASSPRFERTADYTEFAEVPTSTLDGARENNSVVLSGARSAAEQLRLDLQKARPFPNGTILTWTSLSTDGASYVYSAVFTNGDWFTTAKDDNRYVQRVMTHEKLIGYLSSNGHSIAKVGIVTDIEEIVL